MEKDVWCPSLASTHEHICACAHTCTHMYTHSQFLSVRPWVQSPGPPENFKRGKQVLSGMGKDSTITSPGCSCTRPASHSQCLYGSPQCSPIPVPGNPVPSFWPPQAPGLHVVCRHPCRQNTNIHKRQWNKNKKLEKKGKKKYLLKKILFDFFILTWIRANEFISVKARNAKEHSIIFLGAQWTLVVTAGHRRYLHFSSTPGSVTNFEDVEKPNNLFRVPSKTVIRRKQVPLKPLDKGLVHFWGRFPLPSPDFFPTLPASYLNNLLEQSSWRLNKFLLVWPTQNFMGN